MKKQHYGLLGLVTLLALGTLTVSAVIAQGTDPPVNVDEIQEDTIRDLFDEQGNMANPDQKAARIAEEKEGGFGGYYFDQADKRHVYVYMTDITKTEAASAAFHEAYTGNRTITQITPVQGDYAFNDLYRWFGQLDAKFVTNGVHPTSGSVREIDNRIRFGLQDSAQVEQARLLLRDSDVPEGAVVLMEETSDLLADKDSVTAKWRPLVGGIRHQQEFLGVSCTIGFATEKSDVEGIVLASHCTNEDRDIGGVDDAEIHQPTKPFALSNKVADETVDPSLQSMNHSQCPSDYRCRYSDAAFAEITSSQSIDLGRIAKPEAINETDVSPAGTTFRITSEGGFGIGDDIYYIGREEGWQTAEVTDTCDYSTIRTSLQGTGIRIICVGERTTRLGPGGRAGGRT